MLRQSCLLVGPEGVARLVVGVAVQSGLGVQRTLVGRLQLVYGIVVDSRALLGALAGNRCRQTAVGQSHEDAVKPYLVGIDGLVPEDAVSLSARLVLHLRHQQLHGLQVLGFRPLLVHAGNEVARTDVVQVILLDVIVTDAAVPTNHRVGILLTVEADVLATIFKIGVQHALQFYAHHVAPARLLGKVQHVGARRALHLRVGHPF